jgi:hypothetical protein
VQVIAAIRPPAEVPVMIRGRRFASRKALTTPKWSTDHLVSYSAFLHLLNLTISESGPARETERSETQIGIRVLEESFFLVLG